MRTTVAAVTPNGTLQQLAMEFSKRSIPSRSWLSHGAVGLMSETGAPALRNGPRTRRINHVIGNKLVTV